MPLAAAFLAEPTLQVEGLTKQREGGREGGRDGRREAFLFNALSRSASHRDMEAGEI